MTRLLELLACLTGRGGCPAAGLAVRSQGAGPGHHDSYHIIPVGSGGYPVLLVYQPAP